MSFEFTFKNINSTDNKKPTCRIELNGDNIFSGEVQEYVILDADTQDNNVLRIFFENKEGKDTILDNQQQIIQDLNFELEKIIIDGTDLKHLIWQSKYVTEDTVIDSCLFFGPKGHWELAFESPILKWFLKTNHDKNNNDPTWETDYNFYEKVCQKLSKIQTR